MSLGDMLQHFLTVIFSKLDKGETWDDEFELNTILQVQLNSLINPCACYLGRSHGGFIQNLLASNI